MKGTGSIKAFEIISHALKGSIIRTHNESDFEINAVSGQIQKSGKDSFQIKLRVVLTKSGFSAKEGELIKGKAASPLEIEIKKKDMGKIIYA